MVPEAWSLRVLALAALAGLADSVYLTVAHYSSSPLACVQAGIVNCDLVTRSSFGLVPGTAIPVSLAGVAWFLVSLALAVVGGREATSAALASAHLVWGLAGLAVVFYLVYAELRLGHLCEWCTFAHALVVLSALVAAGRLSAHAAAVD